jgi:hypothetical protein
MPVQYNECAIASGIWPWSWSCSNADPLGARKGSISRKTPRATLLLENSGRLQHSGKISRNASYGDSYRGRENPDTPGQDQKVPGR